MQQIANFFNRTGRINCFAHSTRWYLVVGHKGSTTFECTNVVV